MPVTRGGSDILTPAETRLLVAASGNCDVLSVWWDVWTLVRASLSWPTTLKLAIRSINHSTQNSRHNTHAAAYATSLDGLTKFEVCAGGWPMAVKDWLAPPNVKKLSGGS